MSTADWTPYWQQHTHTPGTSIGGSVGETGIVTHPAILKALERAAVAEPPPPSSSPSLKDRITDCLRRGATPERIWDALIAGEDLEAAVPAVPTPAASSDDLAVQAAVRSVSRRRIGLGWRDA